MSNHTLPSMVVHDERLARVMARLHGTEDPIPPLFDFDGEAIVIPLPGITVGPLCSQTERAFSRRGEVRWAYTYYETARGRFCYTPWKDVNGRYWAWTYVPFGKGARDPKAERNFKARDLRRFRTRKAAHRAALKRSRA